jgi:formate dehydrogenase maturation protein FdhE
MRVQELRAANEPAAEILRFYQKVLNFQRTLALEVTSGFKPDVPLRGQVDLSQAAIRMLPLLALAATEGTEVLRQDAKRLIQAGVDVQRQLLHLRLNNTGAERSGVSSFFALACLQPWMENLQLQTAGAANYAGSSCPACGSVPFISILRPEGSGAARWLQCSLCLREWRFRRFACPWCAEEGHDKLTHYTAEELPHVQVEGCETCRHYLKAVDLTVNGRAVPLVDEVASAVLDLWAAAHNYVKIANNVMGF